MAFAAVNTTPSMGEWDIVDGYAIDIRTSSELLGTSSAHNYLVKSIWFDLDADISWVKILDGVTLVCGPVEAHGHPWHIIYESPLIIKGAIMVQTEDNNKFHITMCYRKFATT